ncbi:cell division/cell wall cluster transcriptional repressor MraZ [Jannaschia sp. LMIT008]|uniref:division/cell wall cluster transcriptional repressor MraZ n=1 Tax=Jannaschia maritima TaxID=3032585 RepID=UPI0028121FC9|nr:cell division/cell wall cluster transcriptional repressor MraZ [Jannaschia sp. LMIT008]
MAQRFRGTSRHKVDGKGRVSIPADFRRVLDVQDPDRDPGTNPTVILLHGDDRHPWYECYSVSSMEEMDAKLDDLEDSDPDRYELLSYFYSTAVTLKIDDSGRLILSKALRDRIGIADEAVFQARGKTFRIMAPDASDAAAERLRARLAQMPDDVPITALLSQKKADGA